MRSLTNGELLRRAQIEREKVIAARAVKPHAGGPVVVHAIAVVITSGGDVVRSSSIPGQHVTEIDAERKLVDRIADNTVSNVVGLRTKIGDVNKIIANLDDGKMVRYLDIGPRFLESDGSLSKEIMPDFLHLTEKGYQIWADAVLPVLTELLGK